MKNYKALILGALVDKYEGSKSFLGTNTVNQSFSLKLDKCLPEYGDDSQYEKIHSIQTICKELANKGLISLKFEKSGLLSTVSLNKENLADCYLLLGRKPKSTLNNELVTLLNNYKEKNDLLASFCQKQIEQIKQNKKPEHFSGDFVSYENILKALSYINDIEQETFERDFSIRLFGDSKLFSKIKSSVVSILFEYGDFPIKESVLEDMNIIKNPGHIYFKGAGMISIAEQKLNISNLDGDIGISSSSLKSINNIEVLGKAVISIENLTTFNACKPQNELVIYLGGYHNQARRDFLKKLYSFNPKIDYYHFGDIDAGGFYILLHLRKKTGIHFLPMNMDIKTLKNYKEYTKPLTANDRVRLQRLCNTEFSDVIEYMLENNCKLEQEALD